MWSWLLPILLGVIITAGVVFWLLRKHSVKESLSLFPRIRYTLGDREILGQIYPTGENLPPPYQHILPDAYTTLEDSVRWFTEQSLNKDGIVFSNLSVVVEGQTLVVEFESGDPAAKLYSIQHPRFVKAAAYALPGIKRCKSEMTCWNNDPKEPYVFFLCLGLPLVNHKCVYLLHFPPSKALVQGNYTKAFTYNTLVQRMKNVGNYPYAPIVDVLPIAANFAAKNFPDAYTYFGEYVVEMLHVLAHPPALGDERERALPVLVMGEEPRKTWAKILNKSEISVWDTGRTEDPLFDPPIPWLGLNHPNVTTYNVCPNDPCSKIKDRDIVGNETKDLVGMVWALKMLQEPERAPKDVLEDVVHTWLPQNAELLCIQTKLDTSFSSTAQCHSFDSAKAFCQLHRNDPCTSMDRCDGSGPAGCKTNFNAWMDPAESIWRHF